MKKIYPISVVKFLFLVIFLSLLTLAILTICGCVYEKFKISNSIGLSVFSFISAIVIAIIAIYALIEDIKKCIIFNDEEIYVANDGTAWGFLRRLQYEISIRYTDIINIFLTISVKDSKCKTQFGLFTPMTYIVFECRNGKKKLINVYFYNRKQRAAIIDEAIIRAEALGNHLDISSGTEIVKKFYSKSSKE